MFLVWRLLLVILAMALGGAGTTTVAASTHGYGVVVTTPVRAEPVGTVVEAGGHLRAEPEEAASPPTSALGAPTTPLARSAATNSPHIDPAEIAGKTPAEIDAIARQKGLIPKGPDPASGKGSYLDPVT